MKEMTHEEMMTRVSELKKARGAINRELNALNKILEGMATLKESRSAVGYTVREVIVGAVCEVYEITPEEFHSRRKYKILAEARAAFSWIARNCIERPPSYPALAAWHGRDGGMDHTTVMYHCRIATDWPEGSIEKNCRDRAAELVKERINIQKGIAA